MFVRAGRPGILGTVARTAVVAGTAQAIAGRVNRHQQQRWAAEAAPQTRAAAQPATASATSVTTAQDGNDIVTLLQQLGALRDQGVLTDDEFATKKAQLLAEL